MQCLNNYPQIMIFFILLKATDKTSPGPRQKKPTVNMKEQKTQNMLVMTLSPHTGSGRLEKI